MPRGCFLFKVYKKGDIKLKLKVPEGTVAEIVMRDGSIRIVSAGTHKVTL